MVEERRHVCGKSLLLELEFQRGAFHFAAFFVAQLQLHLIAEQATVDLEGAVVGGFLTEHRRQQGHALGFGHGANGL